MSDETHVKGLADLQKFMDELTPKMERNVMRGALRAGMKEVLPVAKSNIHSVSGQLAAGLKLRTSARGGVVTASIKTGGPHGYLGDMVEYGTAAHVIVPRAAGALDIGGAVVKSAEHPGAKPHPFLRPALDGQAQPAVVAAADYIKTRLADEHGLDTSEVTIEGLE